MPSRERGAVPDGTQCNRGEIQPLKEMTKGDDHETHINRETSAITLAAALALSIGPKAQSQTYGCRSAPFGSFGSFAPGT